MVTVPKSLIFEQLLGLFKSSSDRDAFVKAFNTNYPNLNDQERAALVNMMLEHVDDVLTKPSQASH